MGEKTTKLPPLEDGLLRALMAVDRQIAREMQRSPDETERQGVQKWEPIQKRVEQITSFLLDNLGDSTIELDGLLVLGMALSKTLLLVSEDLGADGLGKVRAAYCQHAFEIMENDTRRALESLGSKRELM